MRSKRLIPRGSRSANRRKPRVLAQNGQAAGHHEMDSCHVRLVHDWLHDEVFTICQHDAVSSVLRGPQFGHDEEWRSIPRPYFGHSLWQLIDSADPREYIILDEAQPGRALTRREVEMSLAPVESATSAFEGTDS